MTQTAIFMIDVATLSTFCLNSCTLALTYGRYRWRYDEVLSVLAGVFKKIKVETSDDKQN